MEHLEIFIFFGFVAQGLLLIAMNELREWRTTVKYKDLEDLIDTVEIRICEKIDEIDHEVDNFRLQLTKFTENLKSIDKNQGSLASDFKAICASQIESKEFIDKASVDLATIVNEYKINGIPLNYQRKPHQDPYDLVEGL